MLSTSKKSKLYAALKAYTKNFIGKYSELDESGTRLMINSFLTDVLGYKPIEEIKTEYMIKHTYADYVIQLRNTRHFLVEVKALSIPLSESHLRQAVNYGANEGIEWALLTNGSQFDFYRILFGKPIDSELVFSIDFNDSEQLKEGVELLQYLHKDEISTGLALLWRKHSALDPCTVAGYFYDPKIIRRLRLALSKKFNHKFDDEEIIQAIGRVICEPMEQEDVKKLRFRSEKPLVDLANVKVVDTPKVDAEKIGIVLTKPD